MQASSAVDRTGGWARCYGVQRIGKMCTREIIISLLFIAISAFCIVVATARLQLHRTRSHGVQCSCARTCKTWVCALARAMSYWAVPAARAGAVAPHRPAEPVHKLGRCLQLDGAGCGFNEIGQQFRFLRVDKKFVMKPCTRTALNAVQHLVVHWGPPR